MQIPDTTNSKQEDGVTQMLRELHQGDSVKATMPVKDFFAKLVRRPVPPTVDSTLTLTYTISVKDIMALPEFLSWRKNKVKSRDEQLIKRYLSENNIQAQRDTSGLYYVIHNSTGDVKPSAENCIVVKYEGRFLKDGRVFDKSDKIQYPLNQMINGWILGFPMLSKGDSATFFIPSGLAYGDGGGRMPPDAILVFDVNLMDFTSEFDPATRTCK
jgi:FKBP-type peptidyl-prolyl cis-trans isomerase FkpA